MVGGSDDADGEWVAVRWAACPKAQGFRLYGLSEALSVEGGTVTPPPPPPPPTPAPILAVDFDAGTIGTEPGFVAQTSYIQTHSTTAGDITVTVAGNPQGFYPFATTGANAALFGDFIFDNSGPFTMTLSGPGISADTDYDMTVWSFYGAQARNTTITAISGTTGTTLGPIAFVNPPTSLSDNAASGLFTSDSSGNLTFSLGAGRPAINGFTITAVGGGGAIPEPATMCALGLAVAGLGGYVRKRRKA